MLSSSIYLFVSKVIGYGIRIILPVFLVRILTKEEYGLYSQFFLLEVLIKVIFQMGVNQSLYYFIPRDRENAGAYFINSLSLNVVLYTVAYTAAWFFRAELAAQTGLVVIERFFWYLAPYTLFMMLNVCTESYLTARQKILPAALYTVVREILASVATLYAAWVYRDLGAVFLALVVSRVVCLLLGLAYVQFKLHGFRAQRYFFGIGEQVRYGIVLGMAGMVWTLVLRMHELFVNRYFDVETYAVYAAGCRQIPILQFFGHSVYVVALGQFATLEKAGNWTGIRRLWNRVLASMYGVGVPVGLVLLAVAGPLVTTMFTDAYSDAVTIFRFNTLASLSFMLNPALVLRAMSRNDVTLKVHLGVLAAAPLVLYAAMKTWGLTGVIAGHMTLVLGGRILATAVLNRLAPVHLAFVPPLADVRTFYADGLHRLRELPARWRSRR